MSIWQLLYRMKKITAEQIWERVDSGAISAGKALATALEAATGLADAALCRLEEEDLDTTTERELLAELWFIGARYSRQQNRRKE